MEAVSKSNEWLQRVIPDVEQVLSAVKSKMTGSEPSEARDTERQEREAEGSENEDEEPNDDRNGSDSDFSEDSAHVRALQRSMYEMVQDISEDDYDDDQSHWDE